MDLNAKTGADGGHDPVAPVFPEPALHAEKMK
jgi:hypothetical protein